MWESPVYAMQVKYFRLPFAITKGAAAKRRYRLENYNLKLSVPFIIKFESRSD